MKGIFLVLLINVILLIQGVLQATKRAFEELGETGWTERLVGFGADGAAVNMGHRGGVIALLKDELGDHIIAFHCMPHR